MNFQKTFQILSIFATAMAKVIEVVEKNSPNTATAKQQRNQ